MPGFRRPDGPQATSLGIGEIHAQPHQVSFDSEASNATGDWTERPDGWVRRCPIPYRVHPLFALHGTAEQPPPELNLRLANEPGGKRDPAAAQSTKETLGESRPAEGRFVGAGRQGEATSLGLNLHTTRRFRVGVLRAARRQRPGVETFPADRCAYTVGCEDATRPSIAPP